MDHLPHFRREVTAFTAAARRAVGSAPPVPSCPGWSVVDLVTHLGRVHRMLAPVIRDRLTEPPTVPAAGPGDETVSAAHTKEAESAAHTKEVVSAAHAKTVVSAALVEWFAEGAEELAAQFGGCRPDEPAWSWSREHTVGFWLRMQTIEAAVHRWDIEGAVDGAADVLDPVVAGDAVSQTFEVMVPARRGWQSAPAGSGETFRFRQTDGPREWTIRFEGDGACLVDGPGDVTLAGTASNLALFLWHRLPAAECGEIEGDPAVLDRYFTLVPPT
ncbi:MAG TPA: maleylpyruvate isomerase family mycothiol-dependent enzyme [Pseudonocardiaceae bacterium]|nr:maleylpyruvate isomerase family mycothiol-dependent enzyme [Pseudonocardiaceae bacterium]